MTYTQEMKNYMKGRIPVWFVPLGPAMLTLAVYMTRLIIEADFDVSFFAIIRTLFVWLGGLTMTGIVVSIVNENRMTWMKKCEKEGRLNEVVSDFESAERATDDSIRIGSKYLFAKNKQKPVLLDDILCVSKKEVELKNSVLHQVQALMKNGKTTILYSVNENEYIAYEMNENIRKIESRLS